MIVIVLWIPCKEEPVAASLGQIVKYSVTPDLDPLPAYLQTDYVVTLPLDDESGLSLGVRLVKSAQIHDNPVNKIATALYHHRYPKAVAKVHGAAVLGFRKPDGKWNVMSKPDIHALQTLLKDLHPLKPAKCPSCKGLGGDSSGPCWDCKGTGWYEVHGPAKTLPKTHFNSEWFKTKLENRP